VTASAEWAWPPAVPGDVISRGLGAPQRPRLAGRPPDTMDHKSLIRVDGLRPSAAEFRDSAARLPGWLLGVARQEAGRRSGAVLLPGSEIDSVAQPAVAAALRAIAGNLDAFGRQSHFAMWTSKFVMREVSARIGCLLRDAHVFALDRGGGSRFPDPPGSQPADHSEWHSLLAGLSRAVEMSLSRQQRAAFISIAVQAVPADVLAAELGTSRNAIYKALFEARRTLCAALAAGGYIQSTISGPILTGPRWLDDLLATETGDAGCELTFMLLDRYADAQLSGHNPQVRFPGAAVHLRSCPACHEDLAGLLLALPAS
jgi:RNA polymerase sigma-70 factor, ECF subfamily